MKTENNVAVTVFAIVMGGAVAWAIAADITNRLCDGVDLGRLNEGRPAFGCFEFWASRYQTTFQTAVTFALTLIGLFFVVRQLRELTRQNEMTAAAVDANRRELAASRRITIAQAIAGLDAYRASAGTLLIEVARQMSTGEAPKRADEFPGLDSLTDASAKILPALVTKDLRKKWAEIKDSFVASYTFVLLHNLPGAKKTFTNNKIGEASIPLEHEAALLRLSEAHAQFSQLIATLEEQMPDD